MVHAITVFPHLDRLEIMISPQPVHFTDSPPFYKKSQSVDVWRDLAARCPNVAHVAVHWPTAEEIMHLKSYLEEEKLKANLRTFVL